MLKKFINSSPVFFEASLILIFLVNLVIIVKPSIGLNLSGFAIQTSAFVFGVAVSCQIYVLSFLIVLYKYISGKKDKVFLIYFMALNIITVLLSAGLGLVEYLNYPNYVYSNFHIYIPYLTRFSHYQLLTVLLGVYVLRGGKFATEFKLVTEFIKYLIRPRNVIIIYLIYLSYNVVIADFPPAVKDEYIQQRNALRMRIDFRYRTTDLPQLAEKSAFLQNAIPNDAVVVIPPQTWDFPDLGNQVLMRYYLYPRKLISYSKLSQYVNDTERKSCDLYFIASRSYIKGNPSFPDFSKLKIQNMSVQYENREVKDFLDISTDEATKLFLDETIFIGVLKIQKCLSSY